MTPLRPDLEDLVPYGAPQVDASVRLNTNESPYPLPAAFAEELAVAVAEIPYHRYPDREATGLRTAIAAHTAHPRDGVWAANGSNEVIQHLCLAYGGAGRRALVFEPTYGLHTLIPRVIGMEIVAESLGDGFALPPDAPDAVARARPAVTFVCSPNNPTGNAQAVEAVDALCAATDGLVIVDEAYGEFGGRTAQPLLGDHANLVVVRTFSKAFGLAAARIGYALGSPEVVEHLARVRLPYHLSALTQAAGLAALRFSREALALLEAVRAERDRIVEGLRAIDGVEAFPSDANFVLFRVAAPATAVWKQLLERGVLIRDVSGAPGLDGCLRVTAGTPAETTTFLEALPAALEDAS